MKPEYKIISDLIEKDAKVLDVGCDDGTLMEFLKTNKNANIRGIEISKEKVQICIAKGLTVIEGNAEFDLKQFPNDSFEYVVLGQTLQAFINPETVIRELLRVGNKAIVTIPNFGHWKVRLNLLFKGTMPITNSLPHDWYNTPNIHMCTIKDFVRFSKIINVVGFIGDKNRIPEIDISLEDNQIWKQDNFEAKIYHVPGHTSGHIAFHFFKEKKIFTGDTLFSLGCGRIFEGTYEQMYNSLKKIKSLPKDTEIYCGHEYTLQNSNFCIANDSGNLKLKNKILEINKKLKNALPTIPSTLADELECNIFLKAKDLESFSKLRDLKDNF